jgi:hypothetical protein
MKKGTYRYFLNGNPIDISETFFIENRDDRVKFVCSIRESETFKTKISVQANLKNEEFHNCRIDYFSDRINLCATYDFSRIKLRFSRKEQGKPIYTKKFALHEKAVFFPLMRCFQGQTILQVAENQDFTTVIVPDIENPNDFENLLKPTFDKRTAKFLKKETICFYQPESVAFEANLYQYLSKHYKENSQFWLNEEGFLVAYRFHQADDKIWEVQLQK